MVVYRRGMRGFGAAIVALATLAVSACGNSDNRSVGPTATLTIPAPTTSPTPTPTPTLPPGRCRGSGDCSIGFERCLEPGGFAGCGIIRATPTTGGCNSDSDCASYGDLFVCEYPDPHECYGSLSRLCLRGCMRDKECPPGEACASSHHCVRRPCSLDSDCPQYFACFSFTGSTPKSCERTGCTTDAPCLGGSCVKGECYSELGTCVPIPE